MQKNQRELVQRLFVLATALLEETHKVAYRGHGRKHKKAVYRYLAQSLSTAGSDLTVISDAILASLRPPPESKARIHE